LLWEGTENRLWLTTKPYLPRGYAISNATRPVHACVPTRFLSMVESPTLTARMRRHIARSRYTRVLPVTIRCGCNRSTAPRCWPKARIAVASTGTRDRTKNLPSKDALIYSAQASLILSARRFVLRRRRQAGCLSRRCGAKLWADRTSPAHEFKGRGDVQKAHQPRRPSCQGSQPWLRRAPHLANLLGIMPPVPNRSEHPNQSGAAGSM
jgi:hypothetical protein